jgi:outer membrane receptor protein involved in Fe transport
MTPTLCRSALGAVCLMPLLLHAAGPQPDLTALPLEQLMSLEVVTASRFPQRVSEAPGTVTVITSDDIRVYGYRTLADALRSVPGLHVSYDRNYSYIGVRGLATTGDYNSRVLLLIDGVRANDNIYDQASLGSDFPIDLDLVERIEFAHGPGSSVYGGNALFGVINVITRSGADLAGGEATVGAGSGRALQGRASWGRRFDNGTEILVSASGLRSRGGDLTYPELAPLGVAGGVVRGLDYDRNRQFLAQFAHGSWGLQLVHAERTKGIPTAAFDTAPGAAGNFTKDSNSSVALRYDGPLRGDTDLAARAYYGRYRYSGDYVYDVPPLVINRDLADGRWWGVEARVVSSAWQGHKIVAGAEYQSDTRKEQANFDVNPRAVYLQDRRRGERFGVFAQDETMLRRDLRLNAGVRYDHVDGGRGIFNPRAALIYTPAPRTSFKLIHGRAYRAPNAYELFYAAPGPGGQKGNPELRPERIRTTELALEYFTFAGWRLAGSVFQHQVRDQIAAIIDPGDGLQVFRNGGSVRSSGATAEVEHLWSSGAKLRASYSHQRALDGAGNWAVNSPRHLLKLNAAVPLGAGLRAGMELQHTSVRRSLAGEVPAFTLANFNLLVPLGVRGDELSFALYNVFDKRYADPGGPEHLQDRIPQDGRTVFGRLRIRF